MVFVFVEDFIDFCYLDEMYIFFIFLENKGFCYLELEYWMMDNGINDG